ncbi:MAG: rhodanese-like domain-containing protein [Gammaproteobacteria bacterium]|nr:MAG: rhodanese-like domain-containing protein [Gammaproteobacteria bacterium]
MQITTFITNHWELFATFGVIVGLLVVTANAARLKGVQSVTPEAATSLINHDDAVIVDVREDKEFKEGHIVNSVHIPMGNIGDHLQDLGKYKDKPIVIACRSGNRSGTVCNTLKKEGFNNVYNLAGGLLAWKNENYPVTK